MDTNVRRVRHTGSEMRSVRRINEMQEFVEEVAGWKLKPDKWGCGVIYSGSGDTILRTTSQKNWRMLEGLYKGARMLAKEE